MKAYSLMVLVILCAVGSIGSAIAKSTSQIPGVCSQSSIGKAFFLKQGSVFNLGYAVNGGASTIGIWHTTIKDNGVAVLLDYTTETEQQGVSITTVGAILGKGSHLIDYLAENLTTGEVCTAQVLTKV